MALKAFASARTLIKTLKCNTVRDILRQRLGTRHPPPASPITPRRQLLMDRVAVLEYKAMTLQSENAKMKENNQNLTPEAKLESQALVWCGCCMHKEMNSVKGGVEGMKLFWESIGGPAPIKLMNKANDAAVAKSQKGSAASENALEVSEGGAVKLTSLLGALFKHKDDKRGQQDTFKLYFEHILGYPISCPDTSNTRFQSHCNCAIFIIIHLPQILFFMSHIMYTKGKIGLNHLEANVLKGIQDVPTLTELAVLALYAISVSYAYMRVVRATGDRQLNALDLGAFHAKVITFCEAVAANTDLLLAPDATYVSGTLDGQPWEHPDVFYAIQCMAPELPNLAGCLKSFMTGAIHRRLETFRGGVPPGRHHCSFISISSGEDLYKSHQRPQRGCSGPSALCGTRSGTAFAHAKVTDAFRGWLRAEARRRVDSGRDRKRRMELIEHAKVVVEEKKAAETKRKARAAQILAELQSLNPILDVEEIEANHRRITVTDIVKNINWHRQFVERGTIPQKTVISKMSKADKAAITGASGVDCWHRRRPGWRRDPDCRELGRRG
ncbi:hypothetical protein B0H12DRAFT_1221612 [Mycena haematopus]|nr:hypothetical protein B0H12DRAFT_1221612 [Mycena haematopus]